MLKVIGARLTKKNSKDIRFISVDIKCRKDGSFTNETTNGLKFLFKDIEQGNIAIVGSKKIGNKREDKLIKEMYRNCALVVNTIRYGR